MPDDLATIVTRTRERCQFSSDPRDMDAMALCEAVEQSQGGTWWDVLQESIAERDRLQTELVSARELLAQALDQACRNGYERDRLRQLLTGLLAKCPACDGIGRLMAWEMEGALERHCPACGPTRKAMEGKP